MSNVHTTVTRTHRIDARNPSNPGETENLGIAYMDGMFTVTVKAPRHAYPYVTLRVDRDSLQHLLAKAIEEADEADAIASWPQPAEAATGHVTYIEGPDVAGHWGWRCFKGDGDGSGYETAADVLAAAQAHGPLAKDSPLPHDTQEVEPDANLDTLPDTRYEANNEQPV